MCLSLVAQKIDQMVLIIGIVRRRRQTLDDDSCLLSVWSLVYWILPISLVGYLGGRYVVWFLDVHKSLDLERIILVGVNIVT